MQKIDITNFTLPKMLYDGDESGFYTFSFDVETENHRIEIKARDFYNNSLTKLKNEISEEKFRQVLTEGKFVKKVELIESYLGTESLRTYYCFKNFEDYDGKFLLVFSFAEIQPTRFKLYLEGIWKE